MSSTSYHHRTFTMGLCAAVVGALALVPLGLPSPAHAVASAVGVNGNELRVESAPGGANKIRIAGVRTRAGAVYVVTDMVGTLTPGSGCTADTASQVRCPAVDVVNYWVSTGDGADVVDVRTLTITGTINGGDGDDNLLPGKGADLVYGGAGVDTVSYAGRSGGVTVGLDNLARDGEVREGDNVWSDVEHLVGGNGPDRLIGDGDPNRLTGGLGDDTLDGGYGADLLLGGDGWDTASYRGRTEPIVASQDGKANDGSTNDLTRTIRDNVKPDVENLVAGSGADTVKGFRESHGGSGNDVMQGDDDSNLEFGVMATTARVYGEAGNDNLSDPDNDPDLDGLAYRGDELYGGDGHDILTGTTDVVDGGAGSDLLRQTSGTFSTVAYYAGRSDPLTLTLDLAANDGAPGEGDDVRTGSVIAGSGNDQIVGSDIADDLDGGAGDDTISGGLGHDSISGGDGNDTLAGDAGNDSFFGGNGTDVLYGDTNGAPAVVGDDLLDGGDGADQMYGQGGNDTLFTGGGADTLLGGDGIDTADYNNSPAGVNVTINGAADDGVVGEGDQVDLTVENVRGSFFADKLFGDGDANVLSAGSGNDSVYGNTGADTLSGGYDDDTLYGGLGNDVLTGDDGADSANGGADADQCEAETEQYCEF